MKVARQVVVTWADGKTEVWRDVSCVESSGRLVMGRVEHEPFVTLTLTEESRVESEEKTEKG